MGKSIRSKIMRHWRAQKRKAIYGPLEMRRTINLSRKLHESLREQKERRTLRTAAAVLLRKKAMIAREEAKRETAADPMEETLVGLDGKELEELHPDLVQTLETEKKEAARFSFKRDSSWRAGGAKDLAKKRAESKMDVVK
eukprot:PLAT14588.1.p2 GENE.PLAT14588.1~~PLAT14588.1.p2  ORF type:complete len:141 (-),score=85.28 PLAT14588.1:95-517(-)